MAKVLGNLNYALGLGVVLLIAVLAGFHGDEIAANPDNWLNWFMRFTHVIVGILWIGLLYYFNFVQIPTMPKVPAELKGGVSKYIAPEALFWFRWAALFTVLVGLLLAVQRGYAIEVLSLGLAGDEPTRGHTLLGIGAWLAVVMFINVWVFIWPNQKIALGLVEADAEAKAKAARTAMLFSRTNLLLSLPMLVAMTMNQTIFG